MDKPADNPKPDKESEPINEPKPVQDQESEPDENPGDILDEPGDELNKLNDDDGAGKTWEKMIQKQLDQGQEKMSAMAGIVTTIQESQTKMMEVISEMTATLKQLIVQPMPNQPGDQKKTSEPEAGEVDQDQAGRSQKKPDQWF